MIKKMLKSLAQKYDWANLAYQLYTAYRDVECRHWLRGLRLQDTLRFDHYGPENPEENLYLIELNSITYGFFALWRVMLQRLDYAERFHLTPVVVWGENTPYWEPSLGGNPYEYFFEPLSHIPWQSVKNSANVVRSRGAADSTGNFSTSGSYPVFDQAAQRDLERYAQLQKKYVRLKPQVEEQIQRDISSLLGGKKTLAVHIRGVEWGEIKGHPVPVGLDAYTQLIDEAMDSHGFQQIFLATDSEATVNAMKARYGDRLVCFQDTARTREGSHTLVIFDQHQQGDLARFRMGYEVLRDMLVLSRSDGLIAGLSNVSTAARAWKRAEGREYAYLHLIQNEILKKGVPVGKAVSDMVNGR